MAGVLGDVTPYPCKDSLGEDVETALSRRQVTTRWISVSRSDRLVQGTETFCLSLKCWYRYDGVNFCMFVPTVNKACAVLCICMYGNVSM